MKSWSDIVTLLIATALALGWSCRGAELFSELPGLPLVNTNLSNAVTVAPPGLANNATQPATRPATNNTSVAFTNGMDGLDDKYRLAIGDRLSFRILEDEDDPKQLDEPKQLFITDSGDLELPYIGRFPTAGKTCKQLAQEVKKELEKEYYYQATVIIAVDVMTKSRGKVYLVGAVRVPGPQEIPSDEVLTVSKAILRAGGFTDFADKHNDKLTRKGAGPDGSERTFIVNVAEILEQGRTEKDLTVEPGDLIYVPEKAIRF
jgi:protein involved in polysaccharide export with SLBB domain